MTSRLLRSALLLILTAVLASLLPARAQIEENVLGLSDENLEGYLAPLRTGLSGTMNAAIFRTGYIPTHKATFSIGAAAMAIGYDDEDRLYTPVDPAGFTSVEQTDVPTVVGDLDGVLVEGEGGLSQVYPGGFDLDGFEIAVPQISLGGLYGTKLTARWIALDLGDSDLGDFAYFGIGGQHSISQYFPNLPVDLAAGVFVQNFRLGDEVIRARAVHFDLMASRQFRVLQPYVGIGYDSMELQVEEEDEDDPDLSVDVDLERESNAHLTLGIQARIPVLSVFFEFNAAAASGFALGVDFGM